MKKIRHKIINQETESDEKVFFRMKDAFARYIGDNLKKDMVYSKDLLVIDI